MDNKPMDSKHTDGCSFASQRSDLASFKWEGGIDEGTAVTTHTLGDETCLRLLQHGCVEQLHGGCSDREI